MASLTQELLEKLPESEREGLLTPDRNGKHWQASMLSTCSVLQVDLATPHFFETI